jgi:2-polyprenyl-3-methyl-5-hydroxy-6-metoxy-1,4-benzoquinol methylase
MNRFDKLAQLWDSKPERVQGAITFVDKIKEHLPNNIENFDVLDYGCGTGLVSFGFSNKVKSILGLDNSSSMIDVYNEKANKVGMLNIAAEFHDINEQKLQESKFDLIVTNMTMHHIKDTNKFIQKLTSSLKVNGYLCIADLKTEDGTFHSDNTGVEHFGFNTSSVMQYFKNQDLKNITCDILENINKPKNSYEVFYIIGQK